MGNLKTDSPLSRRIVRAFLDFLDSVEPAPGVDLEGLEVARECLSEAFKVDSDIVEPGLLVNLFRSFEANLLRNVPATHANHSDSEFNTMGASRDELLGQFLGALEKIHYFKTLPDGNDDPLQLEKATLLFHQAFNEMEKSGCQPYDQNSLAEILKSQGNRAMQLKRYNDAIELYSCAIALSENNAVYYCNRAAAYTQVHKYAEAIRDTHKSIEIDPNYSKAFSRLGLAYYAQGNYRDAIDKGFKKALQLDPNNESIKENIRVAEQKVKEEQQRTAQNQNTSSSSYNYQESNNQSTNESKDHGIPPPFASMPFDTNAIPTEFASMLQNMASNTCAGQPSQDTQREDRNHRRSDEPGVRMGGNIDLNLGETVPEELRGALRSMMQMFSGAAQQGNAQDTADGRSTSS